MSGQSSPLPSPHELRIELPTPRSAQLNVEARRREVAAIALGTDSRPLLVTGPCSIHDEASALEYAERLARLSNQLRDRVVICMRVYLEKPRTCGGWKGFLHDPAIDGSLDVEAGLRRARRLLIAIAELGLGIATELLDPLLAEYHSEFLSWAAIGARTSESQVHRELASSRDFSVGFKNAVDGSTSGAVHSVVTAAQGHTRFGIDASGRACVVKSAGNPACHVVLRGGSAGPNYASEHVEQVSKQLRGHDAPARLLVDCSHGNSGKEHDAQCTVFEDVCRQFERGAPLLGAMLESHLVAGRQPTAPLAELRYGQSITDACIDFSATERLIERLLVASERRQAKFGSASFAASATQLQSAAAATS